MGHQIKKRFKQVTELFQHIHFTLSLMYRNIRLSSSQDFFFVKVNIFRSKRGVWYIYKNNICMFSTPLPSGTIYICQLILIFYSILMEFITPNISRCRVIKWLYHPTTNKFRLDYKFQVSKPFRSLQKVHNSVRNDLNMSLFNH